jgi:osmoprotectant transport system substrate-binding protein
MNLHLGPRRSRRRTTTGLLVAAASALVLSACGGIADDGGGDGPLSGQTIAVGSKDFDEQLVLGNLLKLRLEDAGASVTDRINLGGSEAMRAASVSQEIDINYEYTGTGWIQYLGNTDPIMDSQEQYEAVRDADLEENNLHWLPPAPFNNTYGLALSQESASNLGDPTTISELFETLQEQPEEATICVESEFSTRNDGLPGLEEAYGFEFPRNQITVLDTGVIYTQVAQGDPCNIGEIFTTDGRIAALDLVLVEDDQEFFPLYNPSPVIGDRLFSEAGPELEEVLNPLSEALTYEKILEMNRRVSADGDRPEDVAREFLEEEGLLEDA